VTGTTAVSAATTAGTAVPVTEGPVPAVGAVPDTDGPVPAVVATGTAVVPATEDPVPGVAAVPAVGYWTLSGWNDCPGSHNNWHWTIRIGHRNDHWYWTLCVWNNCHFHNR
jgi:hypothetical protein